MPLPKPEDRYTYQDYLGWDDDERWEIIEGVAYNMAPAPRTTHQSISISLSTHLYTALKTKTCKVFASPIDVYFDEENVTQPDVLVVCDPAKITEKCIQGAPDVIFEILSPSTSHKDRWTKKRLYERFAVKEYILIDIEGKYAERFLLQANGKFHEGDTFQTEDDLIIEHLDQLHIPMQDILDTSFIGGENHAAAKT